MTRSQALATIHRRFGDLPDEDLAVLAWIAERLPFSTFLDNCERQKAQGVETHGGPRVDVVTDKESWATTYVLGAFRAVRVLMGVR